MSIHSDYIKQKNMQCPYRRVFNSVIKRRDSSKTAFQRTLESQKKIFARENALGRIKEGTLKAFYNGRTPIEEYNYRTKEKSTGTAKTNSTSTSTDNTKATSTNNTKTSSTKTKNTNTLNLMDNSSFNVTFEDGNKAVFTCENGQVSLSKETGTLSYEDRNQINNIKQILTGLLHDNSGNYIKNNYSLEEVKGVLSKVGIKPGSFSISGTNNTSNFYMLENGKIYSNYEIEAERRFYNTTDFVKCFGYGKNAQCVIDGNIYKLDKDGSFNIPEGVICVPEKMSITRR